MRVRICEPGLLSSVPTRVARCAQDGVHGVDLAPVHLDHVEVCVAHEHREPNADPALAVGDEQAWRERSCTGKRGRLVAAEGCTALERASTVFQTLAVVGK